MRRFPVSDAAPRVAVLGLLVLAVALGGCNRHNKVKRFDDAFMEGLRGRTVAVLPVDSRHEGNTSSNSMGAAFGLVGMTISKMSQENNADELYLDELDRSTQRILVDAVSEAVRPWGARVSRYGPVADPDAEGGEPARARALAQQTRADAVLALRPHFQAKQGWDQDYPAMTARWTLYDPAGQKRVVVETWAASDTSLGKWQAMDSYDPANRERLLSVARRNAELFVGLMDRARERAQADPPASP